MLVALFSDIHDHLGNLDIALQRAEAHGCEHLLFLGDMAAAATFRHLLMHWHKGIDLVFGNNEWERELFELLAQSRQSVNIHGDAGEVELSGRRLFLTHQPRHAERAVLLGNYDAIFYGHTHCADLRPASAHSPLIVNPGDIQGRYGKPSFAVYSTDDNSACVVSLAPR